MRHQARSYALQALYQAELLQSKAMKHADRFLEQLETSPEIKEFCTGTGSRDAPASKTP